MTFTTYKNETITSIEIGTMEKVAASKFKSKVHGQTYMRFNVIVAPIGGCYMVTVETNYEDTEENIKDYLLYFLAMS